MFGYIRPLVGDMKVRENEMFRAVYCGLCRALGHHTGCASSLTLSYDFVFLALLRGALTGDPFTLERHRCVMHPLKKKTMVQDNETLAYCACAAAILTAAKLQDDLRDEHGLKRTAARSLLPAVSAMRSRALKNVSMKELEDAVYASLARLSALEEAACDSIDEPAGCFGTLLGDIAAWGLDGLPARIAREAGEAVGRFIYVIDAADDAAEDAAKGRYNPILLRYGKDIFEMRPYRSQAESDLPTHEVLRLKRNIAEELYTAALCSLSRLEGALTLMDFDGCVPEIEGILKNIAFLGMPAQWKRVLALDTNSTTNALQGVDKDTI